MSLKDYYRSELWTTMFMIINRISQTPLLRKVLRNPLVLSKQEPAEEEVL